ncbi:MAG: AtpZ/AtpI family protein [Proteobacteria bacterium]|nr:AtpZ/AtpI family protein [Pseudomonadota bacterium]
MDQRPRRRPDKGRPRYWEHLTLVSQVGFTMAGSVILFLLAGFFLDRLLGTGGLFTAMLTVLGVIGGGYTVYRQILKLEADTEDENDT